VKTGFQNITKRIKKLGKKKIIIALFVCALIIMTSVGVKITKSNANAESLTYLATEVTKGNISVSINSSGTLEASKRAEIKLSMILQ